MSDISNILDSEELNSYKIGLKLKNFDALSKAIKMLTIISIGIGIVYLSWEIGNGSIKPSFFDLIGFLIGLTLIALSFSLPFVYLKSWQKLEEFSASKNNQELKKERRFFFVFTIIGLFLSFIWGRFSLNFFYISILSSNSIFFPAHLLVLAAFITVINQIIQIWFTFKAFYVLRKYK